MRQIIENTTFDQERALYGSKGLTLRHCAFDGPADGESALKECEDITVEQGFFNLRYPFWHDHGLRIRESELTPLCRAAIWYSREMEIDRCKLHGIKALRECHQAILRDCDIDSPEFGWFSTEVTLENSRMVSEYAMLQAKNLSLKGVEFRGKYAFQYLQNAVFTDCVLDTKDAFWHSNQVTVRGCVVKGEYLGWYSHGLTLDHCKIIGTQPLCYCTDLRLIDCEMVDCDLAFEKSQVEATVITPVVSIKNPLSGRISVPSVGEVIQDDPTSHGVVVTA